MCIDHDQIQQISIEWISRSDQIIIIIVNNN